MSSEQNPVHCNIMHIYSLARFSTRKLCKQGFFVRYFHCIEIHHAQSFAKRKTLKSFPTAGAFSFVCFSGNGMLRRRLDTFHAQTLWQRWFHPIVGPYHQMVETKAVTVPTWTFRLTSRSAGSCTIHRIQHHRPATVMRSSSESIYSMYIMDSPFWCVQIENPGKNCRIAYYKIKTLTPCIWLLFLDPFGPNSWFWRALRKLKFVLFPGFVYGFIIKRWEKNLPRVWFCSDLGWLNFTRGDLWYLMMINDDVSPYYIFTLIYSPNSYQYYQYISCIYPTPAP